VSELHTLPVSFDDESIYVDLAAVIEATDKKKDCRSNRLFYLAVPPKNYGEIFVALNESGLADETDDSWSHILVEKPFGHDLETAQVLDSELADLYREDQIFRIDHYLAKEAVQNLLSFRFANRLTRVSWNRDSVASVIITMTETIDAGDRAGFYEGVGALRDVGQNHLLQLLALAVMREPPVFTTDAIRNARVEALRSLRPIPTEQFKERVVRAQYQGYEEQMQVSSSDTETYFELMVELGMAEWEGVPFYLRAGKALDKAEVSVEVRFKDVTSGMFETDTCMSAGNVVRLTISPEQTIEVTLNAKAPGIGFQLEPRTLFFCL
jgi:glucose-6-phosphate 1-dehydrogenase